MADLERLAGLLDREFHQSISDLPSTAFSFQVKLSFDVGCDDGTAYNTSEVVTAQVVLGITSLAS
jgi:hypothetical protein